MLAEAAVRVFWQNPFTPLFQSGIGFQRQSKAEAQETDEQTIYFEAKPNTTLDMLVNNLLLSNAGRLETMAVPDYSPYPQFSQALESPVYILVASLWGRTYSSIVYDTHHTTDFSEMYQTSTPYYHAEMPNYEDVVPYEDNPEHLTAKSVYAYQDAARHYETTYKYSVSQRISHSSAGINLEYVMPNVKIWLPNIESKADIPYEKIMPIDGEKSNTVYNGQPGVQVLDLDSRVLNKNKPAISEALPQKPSTARFAFQCGVFDMSEIASGARSDVSEIAYGTYFVHALPMTHQAISEYAQKLITNRQKWGVFDTLAQSKPAISECIEMQSISNTQRNAIAFLAPKKFGNKFLREPEICLPNFSVHAQEHAPTFRSAVLDTYLGSHFTARSWSPTELEVPSATETAKYAQWSNNNSQPQAAGYFFKPRLSQQAAEYVPSLSNKQWVSEALPQKLYAIRNALGDAQYGNNPLQIQVLQISSNPKTQHSVWQTFGYGIHYAAWTPVEIAISLLAKGDVAHNVPNDAKLPTPGQFPDLAFIEYRRAADSPVLSPANYSAAYSPAALNAKEYMEHYQLNGWILPCLTAIVSGSTNRAICNWKIDQSDTSVQTDAYPSLQNVSLNSADTFIDYNPHVLAGHMIYAGPALSAGWIDSLHKKSLESRINSIANSNLENNLPELASSNQSYYGIYNEATASADIDDADTDMIVSKYDSAAKDSPKDGVRDEKKGNVKYESEVKGESTSTATNTTNDKITTVEQESIDDKVSPIAYAAAGVGVGIVGAIGSVVSGLYNKAAAETNAPDTAVTEALSSGKPMLDSKSAKPTKGCYTPKIKLETNIVEDGQERPVDTSENKRRTQCPKITKLELIETGDDYHLFSLIQRNLKDVSNLEGRFIDVKDMGASYSRPYHETKARRIFFGADNVITFIDKILRDEGYVPLYESDGRNVYIVGIMGANAAVKKSTGDDHIDIRVELFDMKSKEKKLPSMTDRLKDPDRYNIRILPRASKGKANQNFSEHIDPGYQTPELRRMPKEGYTLQEFGNGRLGIYEYTPKAGEIFDILLTSQGADDYKGKEGLQILRFIVNNEDTSRYSNLGQIIEDRLAKQKLKPVIKEYETHRDTDSENYQDGKAANNRTRSLDYIQGLRQAAIRMQPGRDAASDGILVVNVVPDGVKGNSAMHPMFEGVSLEDYSSYTGYEANAILVNGKGVSARYRLSSDDKISFALPGYTRSPLKAGLMRTKACFS